jgi:hypothetical protein
MTRALKLVSYLCSCFEKFGRASDDGWQLDSGVDGPTFCTAEDQHTLLANMDPQKATTVHGIFRKIIYRDLILDGLHLLPVVIHYGRSNLSQRPLF